RIFEPYYRGDYALRLPDSTGLGLAIVAQVVELLQGRIAVQSVPDQGTTFTVELPLQWAE
ncbi:MAG: ATP-binding protein, partial [Leptolyngbya sp. SIO4C5]|nr:ATP-binding protein [Leptolyngbya sp. SIO4C5]